MELACVVVRGGECRDRKDEGSRHRDGHADRQEAIPGSGQASAKEKYGTDHASMTKRIAAVSYSRCVTAMPVPLASHRTFNMSSRQKPGSIRGVVSFRCGVRRPCSLMEEPGVFSPGLCRVVALSEVKCQKPFPKMTITSDKPAPGLFRQFDGYPVLDRSGVLLRGAGADFRDYSVGGLHPLHHEQRCVVAGAFGRTADGCRHTSSAPPIATASAST